MSNIVHIDPGGKNRQEIREQASLWVVRLSAGASEKDLCDIHAWLQQNPAHVRALLDVAYIWDEVSVLSELSDIFPLQEYKDPHTGWWRQGLAWSSLSVCTLALFLWAPLVGRLQQPWSAEEPQPVSLQLAYETRIGQQSTVVLPDGSQVLLNTNSRVDVAFNGTSRNIILHRGEGHFTVTKDTSRPFRVHANGGVVEAVGTAFTVQDTQQDGLEVTVVEGVVNFTPTKQPAGATLAPPAPSTRVNTQPEPDLAAISLGAGEWVQVRDTDITIQKQTIPPAELESKLAWREGMLLFQGDPFEEVVREVSRYTSIRIDVDDAVRARNIEVLGLFRTGDVEGFLLTMRDTFNIQVERISAEHIVLKSEN